MNRDEFAERQAAMTATWYEGVKAREVDVDAYIARRHAAYLDRWKEASRFIAPGARVLDIGGGNLFPRLFEHFESARIEYWYCDVDTSAVENSRRLGSSMGVPSGRFKQSFNDKLDYPEGHFDCIFSSHCIEHSIDIAATFSELNRILRPNGNLLVAVPFGWEVNPEHPYFFSPEQWIALLEDSGFQIRVAQIGREYPESGADFFLAARKIGPVCGTQRILATDFKKDSYEFVPHDHWSITYRGNRSIFSDGSMTHLRGEDWGISIRPPRQFSKILPVFVNHDWSAQIKISSPGADSLHDLFSWFHFVQPCLHRGRVLPFESVEICPVGRNVCSRASEGALYGYMID